MLVGTVVKVAVGGGVSVMVAVAVGVGVSVAEGIGVKLGVGELGVKPMGVRVGVFVCVGEARMKVLVGGAGVSSCGAGVLLGGGVSREGARRMATSPAQ